MVAEGYSEPMLSNRLQGAEVKEGLVITIYLKHLRDSPELSIPPFCLEPSSPYLRRPSVTG